jgi:hypothetical protein
MAGLNAKPKGLQEKVLPSDEAFERAEAKAGDARTVTKLREGIWKGNKRSISHTITPELLEQVDKAAQHCGQTRTAIINLAIYAYLKSTSI